jgi:hypothetical protein
MKVGNLERIRSKLVALITLTELFEINFNKACILFELMVLLIFLKIFKVFKHTFHVDNKIFF